VDEQTVKKIFEEFDKNKSGFLTIDEFMVLGFSYFV
jgi:Ca2+-binding EF-hand superfamily protein